PCRLNPSPPSSSIPLQSAPRPSQGIPLRPLHPAFPKYPTARPPPSPEDPPTPPSRAPSLPSLETSNYQIQIGSLKHVLPKKRKTLAYQFSVGGHLSTWPAYASGQAILQSRKPCCLPEGRSKKQASLTIAKPRYLEELECYLRKELQSLDLTKENTQELKLQLT
uniref:Uncharacterized protein n=1 Tax=Gopherus agassizii TaxID=38772 RepID=A0A452GG53_9SAUR